MKYYDIHRNFWWDKDELKTGSVLYIAINNGESGLFICERYLGGGCIEGTFVELDYDKERACYFSGERKKRNFDVNELDDNYGRYIWSEEAELHIGEGTRIYLESNYLELQYKWEGLYDVYVGNGAYITCDKYEDNYIYGILTDEDGENPLEVKLKIEEVVENLNYDCWEYSDYKPTEYQEFKINVVWDKVINKNTGTIFSEKQLSKKKLKKILEKKINDYTK